MAAEVGCMAKSDDKDTGSALVPCTAVIDSVKHFSMSM